MKPLLLALSMIAVATPVFAQTEDAKTKAAREAEERLHTDWAWLGRYQQANAAIPARGAQPRVVFIGDSITQGWEKEGAPVWQTHYAKFDALDLGFGGDRTENVLWRLQNGAVDGLDPKVAVLMIGTNNTGLRGDFPASTVAGIRRNLDEIKQRLPRTRILLMAIFPRDATPESPLRRINEAINAQLPALADGNRVVFLDVNGAFLTPDGTLSKTIMPDLLHPNEAGYAIWAKAMQPELDRLIALPRL